MQCVFAIWQVDIDSNQGCHGTGKKGILSPFFQTGKHREFTINTKICFYTGNLPPTWKYRVKKRSL